MHFYINNFSIRVFEVPALTSLFTMENGRTVLNIKSETGLFNPNASVIMADPFLFVKNNTLYIFYEHLTRWFGTGRICMRSTKDLKTWTEEKDVLIEPFHLSFPYVFEDNGKVYMLPETGGDKSISLYEAVDDTLIHWRLVKKLMESEESWYDSVIHKHRGMYYLFTGHDDNVEQIQHLFVSENLFGPYKKHSASPIAKGNDCGRNAGSIIEYKGEMYRPVQVCVNSYGEQTSIMHIDKLTPTDYQESLYMNTIINTRMKPYKRGGHQWSHVEFMGRRIVATDYRVKNYNLIEFARRVKSVILR